MNDILDVWKDNPTAFKTTEKMRLLMQERGWGILGSCLYMFHTGDPIKKVMPYGDFTTVNLLFAWKTNFVWNIREKWAYDFSLVSSSPCTNWITLEAAIWNSLCWCIRGANCRCPVFILHEEWAVSLVLLLNSFHAKPRTIGSILCLEEIP